MIRSTKRKIVVLYLTARSVVKYFTDREHRESVLEVQRCPECAPLAGEFCDPHDERLNEIAFPDYADEG